MLHCIALHSIILYGTHLCCIPLHCFVLQSILLNCFVLQSTVLHGIVLPCIVNHVIWQLMRIPFYTKTKFRDTNRLLELQNLFSFHLLIKCISSDAKLATFFTVFLYIINNSFIFNCSILYSPSTENQYFGIRIDL